jgi:nucleoid DNA-binding protein
MNEAFHIASETKEEKKRRLEGQKKHKADKRAKLDRVRHQSTRSDIEMINIMREFGIDFLATPRDQVLKMVPEKLEGKRYENLSQKALGFLTENYNIEFVVFDGRPIMTFPKIKQGDDMNLFTEVAEKSGHKRSVVKSVYEAMCSRIRVTLKNERRIRLPELGILKISFRPAKEKRRGRNPFNGKKMWFKAKPASNKLKFSATKDFKTYIAEKIEVKKPEKKKKKKSKD